MEDIQLIALYFARNEDAIRQTEQKYGQQLLGFATRILGSHEDAEECVNDTLLKTWDSGGPYYNLDFFGDYSFIGVHRGSQIDNNGAMHILFTPFFLFYYYFTPKTN